MERIYCSIISFPTALFAAIPILVIIAVYTGNSHWLPLIIFLMVFCLVAIIYWVTKNDMSGMKKERERLKSENVRIWHNKNIHWELSKNGLYLHLCVGYP